MPITPLQKGARYIMVDRGGEGINCYEFILEEIDSKINADY
jgi:ureidoglycolate hydrolase